MKHLLILSLLVHILNASDTSLYQTSLYTGTLFLFLLLLSIVLVMMKKSSQDKELLKEKESKITWLRQIHAENEQKHLEKVKELEKEILRLTHTIEKLELQLAEGTKNQVVQKIEALQKKREQARA
jgi:TolA-binding protein